MMRNILGRDSMKKIISTLILCLVLLGMVFPCTVSADMGPKPSVRITFENMSDEVCYGTLISKTESTGPASVWDGKEENIHSNDLDLDIWRAFVEYQDADGYYFLQWGWLCSETKQLNWTYYPPSSFKILLYYPESDTYAVSDIYERYAFDSYFTVDMDGVKIGNVTSDEAGKEAILTADKSYDYTWETISLVCRIVITIILEILIAFLFKFGQKKLLLVIAGINVITQVLLNVSLNIINYTKGSRAFVWNYILLEIAVFAVEAFIYSLLFGKYSKTERHKEKSVRYAFVANACSFAAGLFIATIIPGIF